MASRTRHWSRRLCSINSQISSTRQCLRTPFLIVDSSARPFSHSRRCKADKIEPSQTSSNKAAQGVQSRPATSNVMDEDLIEEDEEPEEYLTPSKPLTVADLDPEERANYETLSKNEQIKYLALQNHYKALFESPETTEIFNSLADQVERAVERSEGPLEVPRREPLTRKLQGFWAEDEEDEFALVPDGDDEVEPQHITSIAESELEVHREVREYTRIIAWDMPLLQKFAKPFELPSKDQPLRFRYTTYMGETHPASRKVVVQFCVPDLPGLTDAQRLKLKKLLGPRYNPDTEEVKISCEKFEHAAQNKRYLGDLVTSLIKEAKDPKDTFEDIPLDLRHHKPKAKPIYPEEWKLKSKTVQNLLEQRKETLLLEDGNQERIAEEVPVRPVVDGRQMVESYIRNLSRTPARPSPLLR